ncbi:MAG: hypothetical protein A07HR60_02482 [uncultured archaeon A07HR60]|nr:MAG: hypothetical protein A07HR60_02482 [uncultured archaeon A07HR60]
MSDDSRLSRDERPSPAHFEPPPWAEYQQLRQAVTDYMDHDPADPEWADIWRALAAIMSAHQRERFVQTFDLENPADKACIGRLIADADSCPHTSDTQDQELPHSPPCAENATLWVDDTGPAVYSIHVIPDSMGRLQSGTPAQDSWHSIHEFATEWGLRESILPTSWYDVGSAVQVVYMAGE